MGKWFDRLKQHPVFSSHPNDNNDNTDKSPPYVSSVSIVSTGNSSEWQEAFEERAAIMEFDAGLSRQDAENAALENVIRGESI